MQIITTKPRARIKNLDFPYPSWDLFKMETYINNAIYNEYGRRSINVSAVRGCPFQCVFCSRPFGRQVHHRSIESVVAEVKVLKQRYKISFIAFPDDMFISNRHWIMDLCGALKPLKIEWGTSARVDLVDSELLKKMRWAGCEILSFGFESGSQKILDNLKKGVTVRQAEDAIKITRKAGITISGSLMIGMIGETKETVEETIDFVKRTGLVIHRFFYTTPYPNTELYEMAKKMNRLPEDEDKYISSLGEMTKTLLVNLTEMSDEELINLKAYAEKKIRKNFSLKTRFEFWWEEMRRRLN